MVYNTGIKVFSTFHLMSFILSIPRTYGIVNKGIRKYNCIRWYNAEKLCENRG